MDVSRRDFIKKLKDIGIGIGVIPLLDKLPLPEPQPVEIKGEELEFDYTPLLWSASGLATAMGRNAAIDRMERQIRDAFLTRGL